MWLSAHGSCPRGAGPTPATRITRPLFGVRGVRLPGAFKHPEIGRLGLSVWGCNCYWKHLNAKSLKLERGIRNQRPHRACDLHVFRFVCICIAVSSQSPPFLRHKSLQRFENAEGRFWTLADPCIMGRPSSSMSLHVARLFSDWVRHLLVLAQVTSTNLGPASLRSKIKRNYENIKAFVV